MAHIGFKIPSSVIDRLVKIPVPGMREDPAKFHCTLVHLGPDPSEQQANLALKILRELCWVTPAFRCNVESITTFDHPSLRPVIVMLESAELRSVQRSLRNLYDLAGVEYSKRYPFRPHVTLAWVANVRIACVNRPVVHSQTSPLPLPCLDAMTFSVGMLNFWRRGHGEHGIGLGSELR